MFAGQFKSLVSIDYNLSAYLSDSVIDDATLLDTAGRWYAAAENLGDTCYAIDIMLLLFGLSQQHLCLCRWESSAALRASMNHLLLSCL